MMDLEDPPNNFRKRCSDMKVEERKKLHLGEYPTPLEYMGNLTKKYGKGKL